MSNNSENIEKDDEYDEFNMEGSFDDSGYPENNTNKQDIESDTDATNSFLELQDAAINENKDKPFIKTPLGFAAIGVGIIVTFLVGVVVFIPTENETKNKTSSAKKAIVVVNKPVIATPTNEINSGIIDTKNTNLDSVPVKIDVAANATDLNPTFTRPVVNTKLVKADESLVNNSNTPSQFKSTKEETSFSAFGNETSNRDIANLKKLGKKKDKKIMQLTGQVRELQKLIRESATSNLKRIEGFQFLSISTDGKYAVVKSPSRIITLFVGESFYSHYGSHEVTSLDPQHGIIIINEKYKIDSVLEPRTASMMIKRKWSPSKNVKMANVINPDTVPVNSQLTETASKNKKRITEWRLLSSKIDGSRAVIINNKSTVQSLTPGAVLQPYGTVRNITSKGDIVFEDHIITHTNN